MKNQVLSIKKMQHLKELGVETSKASMCWVKDPNSEDRTISIHDEDCYEMSCLRPVPTFTLQDMLEMMPDQLTLKVDEFKLSVNCLLTIDVANYCVFYEFDEEGKHGCAKEAGGSSLLSSAYNMLCWLAENKLLGKEEKK